MRLIAFCGAGTDSSWAKIDGMPNMLRLAGREDLPAIVVLMNAAFRGTGEQRSWSTEFSYITGDRTSESLLLEEIAGGVQLFVVDGEIPGKIVACVALKAISPERWYLGSLAVDPAVQKGGFGRELLETAEAHVAESGASVIEITVVQVRDTLIAWYERRGYVRIGETRPFPYGDTRFGTPLREDLYFVVLEKPLDRI